MLEVKDNMGELFHAKGAKIKYKSCKAWRLSEILAALRENKKLNGLVAVQVCDATEV